MEHHDDGKTMVIEVKKDPETGSKEDDITLTHSSLFPVKPKKTSFFQNPVALAGTLLLLLIVAVFLLISSIGNEHTDPRETTAPTTDELTPPLYPEGSLHVLGLSNAVHITGDIRSEFALLVEVDSMKAVAAKNANEKMYPASLTKIMTFLVAYDELSDRLDKQLMLTEEIHNQYPGASRVFDNDSIGDLLTVEQCMYAMLLQSDTDAVLMLVKEAAGDEATFAKKMNEKADELGLAATHFTNANGLHNANHYTTPAEMAAIFAEALKNELFHSIITTKTYVTYLGYYKNGQPAEYRMTFFNSTLRNRFENNGLSTDLSNGLTIVGGKTGFTDEAKNCQAALAKDPSGKEYIAILGNAPSSKVSATDTATLYESYIK